MECFGLDGCDFVAKPELCDKYFHSTQGWKRGWRVKTLRDILCHKVFTAWGLLCGETVNFFRKRTLYSPCSLHGTWYRETACGIKVWTDAWTDSCSFWASSAIFRSRWPSSGESPCSALYSGPLWGAVLMGTAVALWAALSWSLPPCTGGHIMATIWYSLCAWSIHPHPQP